MAAFGASADVLFTVLAAWAVAIPFVATIAVAVAHRRSIAWPVASAALGAGVVAVLHGVLRRHVLELDAPIVVLAPLAGAYVVAGVVVVVMRWLPPIVWRRRWRVVRLDGPGEAAVLVLDRRGAVLVTAGGGRVEIGWDEVVAIEREHAVARLCWTAADGSVASATLLPDPIDERDDAGDIAETIVRRARGLLPRPRRISP